MLWRSCQLHMDRGCHAPVVNARLWHLACTARELHVRRSRSDSAILCLPEIRCTGRTGVGSVEVIPRPTCTTVYMCTTLGLYLQRRDTRKYAQMYTAKVFVTAGRGDDAGRRDSGGVTGFGAGRLLRVSQGCGFRVRYSIGLGRAAAVSPHMHVKDYITARDT